MRELTSLLQLPMAPPLTQTRLPNPACGLLALVLATLIFAQGCANRPANGESYPPYRERAITQSVDGLSVTVAVPTAEEAETLYGVDLFERWMQPVWIKVRNDSRQPHWLLKPGLDPNYYAPSEAAYAFRAEAENTGHAALYARFDELAFDNPVMPGETASGFVLTNLDEGFKAVDVDLISRSDARSFTFAVADPSFRSVSSMVDFDALYRPDEIVAVEEEAELRRLLEELPCCTTNADSTDYGDPLNLVLVGPKEDILAAGLRRGWHPTEILNLDTIWRTVSSFLEGSRYRYSPISPLYVFGRSQDVAAQKARSTINERNHARFWLTPIRFRGQDVWVGQISRDIGVKYTLKSPTISTHVIDPDVDEARRYMLEDTAYSQALARFGYVKGVGPASPSKPRFNLVDDPYYTDGLRVVMFLGGRPTSLSEIDWLRWETVPPAQWRRQTPAARQGDAQ